MRPGPHFHPCRTCRLPVECRGDLERNVDGWPETICLAYHDTSTGGIADVRCWTCAEADAAHAVADALENVRD